MRYHNEDIIVEFIQQGSYIKVTAVDARTGQEVTMVGDAKQSQQRLQELAVRKLIHVRGKRQQKRCDNAPSRFVQRIDRKGYYNTSGWDV